MKILHLLRRGLLLILLAVIMLSFSFDSDPYYETGYTAVLMERTILEDAIKYGSPQEIEIPGKMYFKDDYILINEKYKGLHIIDNNDPSNPINIGFINIPGNIDISMKLSTLYVDSSVDLVAIDITDLENPIVKARIKYEFPELMPPGMERIPNTYSRENRPDDTEIIRWEKK